MARLKFSAFTFSAFTAIFALTACSKMMPHKTTSAERQANEEAKLCQNMTEKGSAIRAYPEINTETSLQVIKDANLEVEKAVKEIQGSAQMINDPALTEVQTAYQELQTTVNSVPGGRNTVGDASDALQANAKDLRKAWDKLYINMQCGA